MTGCVDPHYQLDLLSGLVTTGLDVDFIGSDAMKDADIVNHENVQFFNLRGSQNTKASSKEKIMRILKYYYRLLRYAVKTDSKLFHIQWENKFLYLDRTLLNIYYKTLGKHLVFTVHNVNSAERDGNDSVFNRLTLKFKYLIADHIIVHTEKMKSQLVSDFKINEPKVTVIPHGINNMIPTTELTKIQARNKIGVSQETKTLLFFGNIVSYKGLEYIISSLVYLKSKYNDFRLIIAGKADNDKLYWNNIEKMIIENNLNKYIIKRIEFIPDEDIEIYFKASDILLLPYKFIFQSGPLFISYNFGLPVIVSNVGSFKEDIIEGKTGFISRSEDPEDLSKKIDLYFQSELYKNLEINREKIIKYANEKYSWEKIGETTYSVYKNLLNQRMS